MEDDWIFLGDGVGGRSESDTVSASDDDDGFTIVRRGREAGGDHRSVVDSDDDAPAGVPHPTPPGLSFRVVSSDGGRREQAGCNDDAASGKAIRGAGIDDAVTCKEGCESADDSAQVGKHDVTGRSVEVSSAPSVAVATAFAPTANCPESDGDECFGADSEDECYGVEYSDVDAESCGEEEEQEEDTVSAAGVGEEESSRVVGVAENCKTDIFAMLLPRERAYGVNIDDYEDESDNGCIDYEEEEEDGSLFDMLLPRERAINDGIEGSGGEEEAATATAACGYNAEEDDIADVAENGKTDIFALLLPRQRAYGGVNIDDYEYEDESEEEEYGSLFDMLLRRERAINEDTDSSDGEEEAATAACGYNAEPSHGTRRQELAGRARGYDDVDTDSDMEEGGDEVAAGVIGTSPAP
jgi:hypothetical protein